MIPIITAPIVVNNNNAVNAERERKLIEDEYTDDMLLGSIYIVDNGFVAKSKMTTDEAIVIKNGILKRIHEKYGDNFTTSNVVLIRDSSVVAEEIRQQNIAYEQERVIFAKCGFAVIAILILIIIYKSYTER